MPGRLRVPITGLACPAEELAGGASHDPDDNCGHAALDRSGIGDRDFLWFHAAISSQDAVVDRGGVGLPLQQSCSRDCSNAARPDDLGDASDLRCRISIGMLELASVSGPACAFSPI